VHVYLDVSGSVDGIRDALYGAVLDLRDRVHDRVHLFSTEVVDVSLEELRRGACRSTGGTDIGCVARHVEVQRVRRALIVTDGFTGVPRGSDRTALERARLAVAWVGPNVNDRDLAEVADVARRVPLFHGGR
jgi:hypothetical protein